MIERGMIQNLGMALGGVMVTVSLAACSSASTPAAGEASPTVSSKPDITTLANSMLLTENEFPHIEGVECVTTKPVRTADSDEQAIDYPGWHIDHPEGAIRIGAQAGLLDCGSRSNPRAGVRMTLILQQPKTDLNAWADTYLPHDSLERIDVAGLPPGAVVVGEKSADSGSDEVFGVVGYVRGVLINLGGSLAGSGLSKDDARKYLVTVFNRQAAKLNAA